MNSNKKGCVILLQRLTAFLVAVNLSFSGNIGYSAPSSFEPALTPIPISLLDVSIPEEMGSIREKLEGQSEQTVFIIQDAHGIPDAQRSIQKLIGFLQTKYGIGLVALEGAASGLDPQIFKSFPDQTLLRKVFEQYFDKGELAGGTAAAIFNPYPSIYHGVEDWGLYEEGIKHYLDAMQIEEGVTNRLASLFEGLRQEKQKYYSKGLLDIDLALQSFRENATDIVTVLEKLAAILPPEKEPEIALLLNEAKRSRENNNSSEMEVKRIADHIGNFLKQKHSVEAKKDLEEFNLKFQEFHTQPVAPEAFALFLKGLATKHQVKIKVSKRLNYLVGNQKRMKDIEGTKFFDDFQKYAQSVKEALFQNDKERKLDARSRQLELLERLAKLELSREDWNEIKEIFNEIQYWSATKSDAGENGDLTKLLGEMRPQVSFYHNARKRDRAFIQKVGALFEKHKAKSAAFIVGGFHAEGLTHELKSKGISYVLATPKINHIPDETHYRDHMEGQVSWSNYFEVKDGRVNLFDAFVRGTRDLLLKLSSEGRERLLKSWRDQIIHDLAAKGKIAEAGQYTQFIDELTQLEDRDGLISKWELNIQHFIDGLRLLKSQNKITDANLEKLLQPAAIPAGATAAPIARSELRADLIGFAKSLFTLANKKSERVRRQRNADVSGENRDSETLINENEGRLQEAICILAGQFKLEGRGRGSLEKLLEVILETDRHGQYGPIHGNNPGISAGPHGPYYLILKEFNIKDPRERKSHAAYLVPNDSEVRKLKERIIKARQAGLINERDADEAIKKIQTYANFLENLLHRFEKEKSTGNWPESLFLEFAQKGLEIDIFNPELLSDAQFVQYIKEFMEVMLLSGRRSVFKPKFWLSTDTGKNLRFRVELEPAGYRNLDLKERLIKYNFWEAMENGWQNRKSRWQFWRKDPALAVFSPEVVRSLDALDHKLRTIGSKVIFGDSSERWVGVVVVPEFSEKKYTEISLDLNKAYRFNYWKEPIEINLGEDKLIITKRKKKSEPFKSFLTSSRVDFYVEDPKRNTAQLLNPGESVELTLERGSKTTYKIEIEHIPDEVFSIKVLSSEGGSIRVKVPGLQGSRSELRTQLEESSEDFTSALPLNMGTAAKNVVRVLGPNGGESLDRSELRQIADLSANDFEKLVRAIQDELEEGIVALKEQDTDQGQNGRIIAVRGAIDLAKRLLTPNSGEGWPENITFAINFLNDSDSATFFDQLIKQVGENGVSAEILSDARTHQTLSKKITPSSRQSIRLKKLAPNDLNRGTVVNEEGMGVITAVDNVETRGVNSMFQRLLFNQEGMSSDSDTLLAGQILFASFLVKLSILSAQHKNYVGPDRAAFLKGELIKAIGEAGYTIDEKAFASQSGGLISIMGNVIINALVQDIKARAEISKAA